MCRICCKKLLSLFRCGSFDALQFQMKGKHDDRILWGRNSSKASSMRPMMAEKSVERVNCYWVWFLWGARYYIQYVECEEEISIRWLFLPQCLSVVNRAWFTRWTPEICFRSVGNAVCGEMFATAVFSVRHLCQQWFIFIAGFSS